jgi:two-component system OmpR family sensor kinase
MTALPSIRQRLSRTLLVISVVWGIAVTAAVWFAVRHEVDELLDNTLQESAEILFGLLSFNLEQLPMQGGGAMPAPVHDEPTVWQIVDMNNMVVLRSHRAPDQPLAAQRSKGLSNGGETWRVYSIPFEARNLVLHVAQRGTERGEARIEAASTTSVAALMVGLMCALWLRSRVRNELEPIGSMSDSIAAFDPLRADRTLAPATRAELVPMRQAIDDLGVRLARQMAHERNFSGHAAHALRTPLAGMVAQLAVAQRKAPPDVQGHLSRTREAADQLRRVVEALLILFRTGGHLEQRSIDVAELVSHLPFATLSISAEHNEPVNGDPDLLAAALMNLLDNSVRHGAKMATVTTRVGNQGKCIEVHDDGSGLSEEQRLSLQSALDAQSYEGQTGLGLMLADMVARAHDGRLVIVPCYSGCTVEIWLGD